MKKIAGYVYLAHHPGSGLYKIGRSKNPKRRIAEISRPSQKVHLIATIPSKSTIWLERYLHIAFSVKYRGGEWFELNSDDVALFKTVPFADRISDLPPAIIELMSNAPRFERSKTPTVVCEEQLVRVNISKRMANAIDAYLKEHSFATSPREVRRNRPAFARKAVEKLLVKAGFWPEDFPPPKKDSK